MCEEDYEYFDDFDNRAGRLEIVLDAAYEWTKELLSTRGPVQFETPPWLQEAHAILNEGMPHVVIPGSGTIREAPRPSREIAEASSTPPPRNEAT